MIVFQFKHTCMFLTKVEYSDLKKGFQQENQKGECVTHVFSESLALTMKIRKENV